MAAVNNSTVSGNRLTASSSPNSSAYTLYMLISTGLTLPGNMLNGTGGAGRRYMRLQNVTISAGSTGNTATTGICGTAGGNTGFVDFANAANCGP